MPLQEYLQQESVCQENRNVLGKKVGVVGGVGKIRSGVSGVGPLGRELDILVDPTVTASGVRWTRRKRLE